MRYPQNWLSQSRQDLLYGLRIFSRTPGFTLLVILTLALGVGATSAIFSIVYAVLLHPLPYSHADHLVVVWEKLARDQTGPPVFDSYSDFLAWKDHSRGFEQLAPATWAVGGQIMTGHGPARDVLAMPVGIDFFSLLGVAPSLGRTFQPADLRAGCTVVLKHSFWQSVFGGQPGVIGRPIQLDQKSCTIAGVMPSGFTFYPDALSMWMLITPDSPIARDPRHANVGVFGRLKPGVSLSQGQRELELLFRNQHRGEADPDPRVPVVYPLAEQFAYLTGPNLRLSIVILFAAVTFVLLIACVNIANLLLGRSLIRRKELAVRAALGSGRARLMRQLLLEGLLLSVSGAALGILLAMLAVHYFRVVNPIEMPPGTPVQINLAVLAFTVVLAFLAALLFGLVPAFKASRVDLVTALGAGSRTVSLGPAVQAFRGFLVILEVTLSLALLAGAALLIQSVSRLTSVPLGFQPDHVFSQSVELPKWSYSTDAQRARFIDELLRRTGNLAGIESSAFVSSSPLDYGRWGGNALTIEGQPQPNPATAPRDISQVSISPQYFQLMSVPLQQGRVFDSRDRSQSQPVAIVNQALVRKYFPRQNPLGRHIRVGEPATSAPWLTIVGVSSSEKSKDFFREMAWNEIPQVFRPVSQLPPSTGSLLLRAASDQLNLGAAIQKQIAAIDSSVPVGDLQSMRARLSHVLAYPRFRAVVLGTFAGLALLLAALGLYGVLSQFIAQRTSEIGVRMALGAQRRDVLSLVIRQGMLLVAAGLAAGLLAAFSLTRFVASLLYGLTATDPVTLAAVSLLLITVSLLAASIPAWRASRVDPMVALRHE